MKIKTVTHAESMPPLFTQNCILVSDGESGYMPLIYLQRPKWIKKDACWEEICESVEIKLPIGYEVT